MMVMVMIMTMIMVMMVNNKKTQLIVKEEGAASGYGIGRYNGNDNGSDNDDVPISQILALTKHIHSKLSSRPQSGQKGVNLAQTTPRQRKLSFQLKIGPDTLLLQNGNLPIWRCFQSNSEQFRAIPSIAKNTFFDSFEPENAPKCVQTWPKTTAFGTFGPRIPSNSEQFRTIPSNAADSRQRGRKHKFAQNWHQLPHLQLQHAKLPFCPCGALHRPILPTHASLRQ